MDNLQARAKGERGRISWASALLLGPALHGQAAAALFGEQQLQRQKTKDKRQKRKK